jgi:hypothetical protein
VTLRHLLAALALAAIAALAASPLQAQAPNLYWEGGNGFLTNANYTDLSLTGLTPAPSDNVYFGGDTNTGVTGTLSGVGSVSFNRFFVGHNEASPLNGDGTVTVSGGAQINITGGAPGSNNAGLTVGSIRNGVLNIDGAGSSVTSNRLIVIGFANGQPNRSGTVNVTNGGALIASDGNIDLGTNPGGNAQTGMQGHLVVSGEGSLVQVNGGGADLNVGVRKTMSSVTQTGGAIEVNDVIEVGFGGDGTVANADSSYSISGGSTTNGGNFFLGRGASTNATLNLSGDGILKVGNRFLMGAHSATGVTVNHTGGELKTVLDVRVGDSGTADSTYNLSGTGVINSTTGGIVGRQGTGKFIQTGGEANYFDLVRIGARETAPEATDGLYKISAGIMTAGAAIGTDALSIAPNGTGEFRVVGDDAAITIYGNALVSSTANGDGTLAYELEGSELLSVINVTDAAMFGLGSKLVFDVSNALPTQTSYDLLTATSITDNGIDFSGPAGWSYQIVSGGNGQILQAFGPLIAADDADFDQDGDVDGADFLTWQRNVTTASPTLAQGNANGDSVVDGIDLGIWEAQYGTSVAAATNVPEPTAGALLLVSLATVAAWRRRTKI